MKSYLIHFHPFFILALMAFPMSSATWTWDGGGGDHRWFSAANWAPDGVPGPGNDLEFNGGLPLVSTNDFPSGTELGNITFSAPGYAVHGNPVQLTNGLTVLGSIGPILWHPNVTLNADQRFTVSRFFGRLELFGELNLNGFTLEFLIAGTNHVFGPVSGNGGLAFTGGALILHADNTWSGTAQISGGSFLVHGSNPAINVDVGGLARFGGHGTVQRIISSGGTVIPGGDEPGILTAAATTTLDSQTTYSVQINGNNAGSQYDQLVTSSATLDNAVLEINIGYPMLLGETFTVIEVTGRAPVSGTFADLDEGATFARDNMKFQITYAGGNGNDVVITAMEQQPTGITRTWDGGGSDGFWSTPENWVDDEAPRPGDSLAFVGMVQQSNTNNFPSGVGFTVIDIQTAGFELHGNAIGLLAQLRGSYFSGVSTLGVDLQLAGPFVSFLKLNDIEGELHVAGDIDLNGRTLTLICEGGIELSGAVTGNGSLSKGRDRALRLVGDDSNTFSGQTIIFGGACELGKTPGATAVPGEMIIGSASSSMAEVNLLANEQISNTSTVTVFQAGVFNLGEFDETIQSLCLTGGVATTLSGTLTVLSNVQTKLSETTALISGNLAVAENGEVDFVVPNGVAEPDLDISAVVSGGSTASLRKVGSGQMRLSGGSPNTLAGAIRAHAGTLELAKIDTGRVAAIAGPLELGDGFGPEVRVLWLASHQIVDTAPIFLSQRGLLDLNDHEEVVGPLTFVGGRVTTGAGLLTLASEVHTRGSVDGSEIDGRVSLGSGPLRLFDIAAAANLEINAQISGAPVVTLVKTNQGRLTLNASNVFAGAVSVAEGTLIVTTNVALGDAIAGTFLDGGTLMLSNTTVAGEFLTVHRGGLRGMRIAAWNGDVMLSGDARVFTDPPTVFAFTGQISGPGGFVKNSPGAMRFRGQVDNTFTGTTRVNEGRLEIYNVDSLAVPGPLIAGDGIGAPASVVVLYGGHDEIADVSSVTVHSDAVLNLQAWTDTIGSLRGAGEVNLNSGGLTIGG